jgi:hypothetical protein
VFGCHVHGIDLSVNAILVAIERAAATAAASHIGGGNPPSSSHIGYGLPGARNGNGVSTSGVATPSAAAGAGAASPSSNGHQQRPHGSPLSPSKQQQAPHDVTFEVADVLTRDFPEGSFDVVVSRDSLLHVEDKQRLFARCVFVCCTALCFTSLPCACFILTPVALLHTHP